MNAQLTYVADFYLNPPLREESLEQAQNFLKNIELKELITKDTPRLDEAIKSVRIKLLDEEYGQVLIITTMKLSEEAKDTVSKYLERHISNVEANFGEQKFAQSVWCEYSEEPISSNECSKCDRLLEHCEQKDCIHTFETKSDKYEVVLCDK